MANILHVEILREFRSQTLLLVTHVSLGMMEGETIKF